MRMAHLEIRRCSDVDVALKSMRQEEANLAQEAFSTPACSDGVCSFVARRIVALLGVRPSPHASVGGWSRGSQSNSASVKLAAVAETCREQLLQLTEDAQRHRTEAVKCRAVRPQALDALRRAQACDRRAKGVQAALSACEQQIDLLEQSTLQVQLAAALGGAKKAFERSKGLVGQTERAVDSAMELHDLNADVSGALAELGSVGIDVCEDELLAELETLAETADMDAAENAYMEAAPASHETTKAAAAIEAKYETQKPRPKAQRKQVDAQPLLANAT